MIGQSTERAPHASVVLPHFAFSTLSFLVLAVLLFFADSELLGHFFQGKLLALTHIATLGWITMVIFGALYQLIPVVLEVPLFSEKLAKVNFWIFAIGIVGLIPAFWLNKFGMELLIPSAFLLVAFLLFSLNVIITASRSSKWSTEARMVISSVVWFLTTGVLGFLLSLNFTVNFIPISHIEYLKVHAHTGLVGWFLLLIMGVGSILIPMFFLSHKMDKRKTTVAFYATNIGLLFFAVDYMFFQWHIIWVPIVLIGLGLFAFLSFIYESYKKRVRRKLDIGMKHTVVSLLFAILPVVLAILAHFTLGWDGRLMMRITTLYGASILLGFITSLILGQYYKTLPFIIWLWRYQEHVGKFKTPLPKELYSETLLKAQYWLFNISVGTLFIGLALGISLLIQIGAACLILTALVFNLNVIKMFLHKKTLTKL